MCLFVSTCVWEERDGNTLFLWMSFPRIRRQDAGKLTSPVHDQLPVLCVCDVLGSPLVPLLPAASAAQGIETRRDMHLFSP